MKTNFKRLFALLLTLCMLASLMVPVAFAEDPTTEATPAAIEAETYPIRLKDLSHTDPATANGNDLLMVRSSSSGTAYYNYALDTNHSSQSSIVDKLTSAYKDGTLNWMPLAASGEFVYRKDAMYQARLDSGKWAAIQIRVSDPGLYALNLTTDRTVDVETTETPWTSSTFKDGVATTDNSVWSGDVNAYIIPVAVYNEAVENKTVTTETTDGTVTTVPTAEEIIPDLMTDKYLVGSKSVAADQSDITFDKVRMDYDEYVVVYQASNPSKKTFFLSKMSLLGEAYAKEKVTSYALRPYDVTNTDPATYAGTYNADLITTSTDETTGETTYTYVEKLEMSQLSSSKGTRYEALGWQYVGASEGWVRARPDRAWQPMSNKANANVAIKINVPASGAMYLSLVTDKSAPVEGSPWTYSANTWTGKVTAYLVPAADYVDIATAAVDANCIGTKNLLDNETTVTFNKTDIEAGEYVFIYSASAIYYPVCELKLDRLSVDKAPEKADIQISETYNIALYNETSDPTFAQYSDFSDEVSEGVNFRAYADAAYEAGKLNWKLENYADKFTDSVFTFQIGEDGGMRIYTPADSADDWFAYRIRVPHGGYYSISFRGNKVCTGNLTFYMFPAAAETMAPEDIADQMTEANALFYNPTNTKLDDEISVGYLDGEYIIAVHAPHASKSRTIFLNTITLNTETFTAEDVQNYNLNLFDETNTGYYELATSDRYAQVKEKVLDEEGNPVLDENGEETYKVVGYEQTTPLAEASSASFKTTYFVTDTNNGEPVYDNFYKLVLKADGSGYPNNLNWRPDRLYDGKTLSAPIDTVMENHMVFDAAACYRMDFEKTVSGTPYGSLMLHVDKAGTYDLNITASSVSTYNDIYFVDTLASWTGAKTDDQLTAYMADDTWLVNKVDDVKLTAKTAVNVGRVTVDAAGDFLIIFKAAGESGKADVYLKDITLTPVVEEAAAGFNGEAYASLQDALDAAATDGGTVHLLDVVINGGDIEIPAGVTLNLNGQTVCADSLDAAGNVIDTLDGQAAVYVDEVAFEVDNPQLPLLDKTTGAYHLFNVDVVSSATTGSGGYTKYWFKVNFSNADALALIGSSTELRINALMTGVYKDDYSDPDLAGTNFAATASADAAFSCTWAENSNKYIVVYSVGSGLNSFRLSPAVSANGVIISGDAMTKG